MKAMYLIRHSITEGVERRLYYGATDLPLTEAGIRLCESLRGSFDIAEGASFATTGLIRTEETLLHLFGDVEHSVYPALRELNCGEFEMHSYDELKDNPAYQTWLMDSVGDFHIPGGESKNEMLHRVMDCIRELSRSAVSDLVIICHGGTICNAMTNLFPNDCESFYDWSPKPCHGYAIFFEDGEARSFKAI